MNTTQNADEGGGGLKSLKFCERHKWKPPNYAVMVLQLLISLLKSPSYNKYKACSKSVRIFNYECEEYTHDISAAMFTYSLSPVVKVFH